MSSPLNKQPIARAFSNGTNLEDLTINQSGLPCSPKGSTKGNEKMVSPGRVRTMKEYEEQMAELKKENFNLKLRIYFIEERQEQMKGLKDVDELFNKNVELSCELETVKKDLTEKEELLLQSAKAMEILQSQHKKQIEELKQISARDKAYLEDHISNLQKILREKEQTINQFDDSSAMYAMAFGYNKGTEQTRELEDLKSELNNVTLKVVQLEEQLQEEKKRYFALECELEQAHEESARLKNQVTSLETDVEKRDARLQQAYLDVDRKTEQLNTITRANKRDKAKADQLLEKEKKVFELETKIGELERRLQAGGVSTSGGGRKSGSSDLSSNSKDGVTRQRVRRAEDKGLAKQLQDANGKLTQLEEQAQIMQTRLHEAQLTCDNKDSDISRLQEEYHKACITIQALLKKNKLREKEVLLLQSEIEKKEKLIQEMSLPLRSSFPSSDNCESGDLSNEELRNQLAMAQEKIAELAQERSTVTSEMEIQMQNLKKSLQEKEIRLKELEEKVNSVSLSECKDNRTAELESKLEEMKIKLQSIQHENKYDEAEGGKLDSFKDDKLLLELENKNKEVECLKSELRKRTFNLQELVNKELWDKNREIEKLNKLCERRQMEIIQLKQQLSSSDAHVSFSHEKLKDCGNFSNFMMREVQIMNFDEIKENCSSHVFVSEDKKTLRDQLLQCWEEKKFLVRKVDELEERLQNMPERDSDSRLIQTLKSDLTKARQDVETAEKSRKDVIAACSLLTNRLQELADFLDSLLPSLGAKKRRVVQHAVERSRELSRSFSAAADDNNSWQNLQPSLYTSLLPDFSTVDFWSGDDITDLTLEEEANDEVDVITQLRSKVEFLEEELKQRDTELNKFQSQYTPNFQSMWSLGTNELESLGAESNNLAKLVSMFENLEANENIDIMKEDNNNDDNLDSFISGKNNVILRNELKSSNIGEIIITSKKVSSKEDKSQNIGSESEAWSEPDRSVSLARIGLTDDTTAQSWVHDDSSDTTDNGQKNSLSGKRNKYEAGELRRLQSKVRSLEEANEALRGELSILHKLAPPGLSSMEDKSTSIEVFTETMPVPPHVLDEIRNQREKLECAIHYNDNIRRQLEAIFVSLKIQDKSPSLQQIFKDDLTSINERCVELENECTALKSECAELQVSLQNEQLALKKKEEQAEKLEKEFSVSKEALKTWEEKAESLQDKVDELENELKLKCSEVIEKQDSFLQCQNDAQLKYDKFERKIKEMETQLKEEKERWLSKETEMKSRMVALQTECDELKKKLKQCNEEKNNICVQLEFFKLEDEKCQKQINDLTNRLKECKTTEEKLLYMVEEWKVKWHNCQKDAEDVKTRLSEAEKKIVEMEKINSELEMGFRGQVEAASRQCSKAESKIKDLEMKHKTSQLERVKIELERRVAELEAANSELETRLTALQVTKVPSDSENEDQENISRFPNSKQIHWPSTSSSPPLSPSSKPVSPLVPLSPRYTRQRSNDISSDYMSDQDNGQTCNVFWPQRTPISASPDLGIESDQGRLSSLETNSHPHTVSIRIDDGLSELAKLEEENTYLRQHLMRTRQALENTLTQLTAANHKKRQVERAICRQLGKTHLILKKARVNLETDVDG